MRLVDSHSHFDVADFDDDREAALARARAAGVDTQVLPAYVASGWERLRETCAGHDGLHAAYGLHPVYLDDHRPADLDALPGWISRERPCAVGECGLDWFIDRPDRERQRAILVRQLELAKDFDLPVILHARRAVDDVTAAIRRIGGLRGVVHSFAGSDQQADALFALGFHIGIGGPVTYERASRLRRIVANMPLEFLLLETDSPDQPMHGHRGARNEPAFLVEVLRVVAQLRGESEERVAEATTANAERLFDLQEGREPRP
ncbi:MAG TPA: TatD family hydrolase [Xanthomonadales bacterium]|nr:TatD family hydrolase [Xanthomonadales bacterium]